MAIVGLLTFIPSFLSICGTMPRQPRLPAQAGNGDKSFDSTGIGHPTAHAKHLRVSHKFDSAALGFRCPYCSETARLPAPVEDGLRQGDVGLALCGIVGGKVPIHYLGLRAGHRNDLAREFQDGEFARVAQIHGAGEIIGGVHEPHQAVHQVIYVTKRTGLLAIAVDGDRLALQSLDDEVGDNPAIVRVHARAVGIEDAGHLDLELVLAVTTVRLNEGANR